MKSFAMVLAILTFLGNGFSQPPQGETAKSVEGDWQGTLKAGGAELRLVVHIAKNPDGGLKGTMDSIDQGANGIPITSISFRETKLKFTVNSIMGAFEGKANSDLTVIAGTWIQAGNSLPLDLNRLAKPVKTEHKAATPSDINGAWMGTLEAGAVKLRVVFHIFNTEDGLMATFDSPDQGAKGIPVTQVTRENASLKMQIKAIGGVFEGQIARDLSAIEGTWTQAGSLPLVLKRVKDTSELERRRPQNPVRPYPYHEEEVVYENPVARIKLAATLTLPQGKGPFPAVVLITGSGPQDRDETIYGHKPFLVLSDYLTRRGIAVLRADDRGVAKSGGNFQTASTADFATDAEAGVAYLKTRPEVNKIGLIGHSEGGTMATTVAARNPDVSFIVMLAGAGVPGDQLLVEQVRLLSEVLGATHDKALKDAAEEREFLTMVKGERDPAVLDQKLREMLAGKVPEPQLSLQVKQVTSPWFMYFIEYDPATALHKVTCPVLVLNGEKDLQVPPQQNLPAIRKALEEAGNKHFETDELPGLNHLFQTARTGAPSEYAEIEETMSPVALDKVAGWILKQ